MLQLQHVFKTTKQIGIKMRQEIEEKYTDSLFYEVFLTGKYIKKMGEHIFRVLEVEFTAEEFSALDFLYKSQSICQRDLALKMLINRANMGKILNGLEKRGYITRKLDTKCNHPVKIVSLTEKGEATYLNTVSKLKATGEKATKEISKEEAEVIIGGLKKIRKVLKDIIDVDI